MEPLPHHAGRRAHDGLPQRQARRRSRAAWRTSGTAKSAAAGARGRSSCRRTAARSAGGTSSSARSAPTRPTPSSASTASAGFQDVFNGKDFDGWAGPLENYEVKDGAIVCKPKKGGNIYTKEEYADFVARVEYRLPPGGNNGLAIRYPGKGQPSQVAMCEVQILDDDGDEVREARPPPVQRLGLRHDPRRTRGYLRPVGEWNFMEVTAVGKSVRVELNGTRILDGDLSKVTKFMGNKAHPGKDRPRGHFGFCGHNDPVAFRLVQIRELGKKAKNRLTRSLILDAGTATRGDGVRGCEQRSPVLSTATK